jgi:sulfite exporter TauE/SafE
MSWSPLISAWLAGALGGVHCVAMCGGFVAALAARDGAQTAPLRRATAILWRQFPYHLGRVSSYALLGAAFGAVGAMALAAANLLPLQRVLYVVANLFLLLLALAIAMRAGGGGQLQRAGAMLFARLLPLVKRLQASDTVPSRVGFGLVWGLVPCGLTYSVLPLALFAGNAIEGGAIMLAFGIGKLPSLLVVGWAMSRARRWVENSVVRYGAAALLAAFAAAGIWRALFGPMATGNGPFCIVP